MVNWDRAGPLLILIVAMIGVGYLVKWGLGRWDWWFLVPWLLGCFFIAWLIDRREKRARESMLDLPPSPHSRSLEGDRRDD